MNYEEQFTNADRLYNEGKYDEAFKQFLSLAKLGYVSAMARVACMYDDGKGVEYSFEESVMWNIKAAESGEVISMFNLGINYRNKADMVNSKKWFEKALQAGEGEAAIELAKMYLISELEIERVKNYLRLALKDNGIHEESRNEAQKLLSELGG